MWFVFYIIAVDYPKLEYQSAVEPSEITGPEKETTLAYAEDEA
jgi:hypothetical protein